MTNLQVHLMVLSFYHLHHEQNSPQPPTDCVLFISKLIWLLGTINHPCPQMQLSTNGCRLIKHMAHPRKKNDDSFSFCCIIMCLAAQKLSGKIQFHHYDGEEFLGNVLNNIVGTGAVMFMKALQQLEDCAAPFSCCCH